MARRMEIELTSSRDDENFTWRAAGAKEPRGIIAKSLLLPEAHPGDVVRVEADFDLEGIVITAVLPSKSRSPLPDRIEIQSPARPNEGGVTTSLVEKTPRRGRPRDAGRTGRDGEDRPRRERRTRTGERTPRTDERTARTGEQQRRPERRTDASPGPDRRSRASETDQSEARPGREAARTRRPRPPRLTPGTQHRDALLATLPPEQQPIAEQLAVGGMPAVRRAIEQEQQVAREAGRPAVAVDAIVALAEQIFPAVREAVWLDRAEAVRAQLESVSLRDLRATVVGAAPRDEVGRELLRSLRSSLDERLAKLRTTWEEELQHALEEQKVLQALRLSARPPEPTARFPAALVQPLAEAAGAALNEKTPPERYLALLEAAAASPIRRSIKPTGLPEDPTGAVHKAASLTAGRIPALAPLLGLAMPPPPRPLPPPAPRRPREKANEGPAPVGRADSAPPASPAPLVNAETPLPADVVEAASADLVEDRVVEDRVVEDRVAEAPVAEAPVVEAPVVEAPVVEAPVVEAPVVEAPVVEAPVVEAPVVEAVLATADDVVELDGPDGAAPDVGASGEIDVAPPPLIDEAPPTLETAPPAASSVAETLHVTASDDADAVTTPTDDSESSAS